MGILRCFLSYTAADEDLVKQVAVALQQRGVVPWLAPWEQLLGGGLDEVLTREVGTQGMLFAFLSEAATRSYWVGIELDAALASLPSRAIVPVYLDEPLPLVRHWPRLDAWLTPRGDRADKIGIYEPSRDAGRVAEQLAGAMFSHHRTMDAQQAVVAIDHRGAGQRVGTKVLAVPGRLLSDRWPALIFRPDAGERGTRDVLPPDQWEHFAKTMARTIEEHLPLQQPGFELHVCAPAELSLGAALGRRLNRKYRMLRLTTHNSRPLKGSEPSFSVEFNAFGDDATVVDPDMRPLRDGDSLPSGRHAELAVLVGGLTNNPVYPEQVADHLTSIGGPPGVWLPFPGYLVDTSDALRVIERLKAVVLQLRVQHLHLFSAGPEHLMPLLTSLAAMLRRIDFYENDARELDDRGRYVVRRLDW